jgi:membrane fusion protein (multidrug efflux system)
VTFMRYRFQNLYSSPDLVVGDENIMTRESDNPIAASAKLMGRLGLIAGMVVVAACGEADGAPEPAGEAFVRVVNVEVAELEPSQFVEDIRLTGTIQASRDVMISAEENGVIREVLVDKGQPVRAGAALLQIDSALLEAQVAEARAQSELARETWERRRRLWEEDGVGSELAYLEARYAADQAQARLATLEERLARTVIRAPFSGVFDERRVDVGSLVSAGTVVGRIISLDPVKVTAGVPERYAADVKAGAEVDVRFDALSGQLFKGSVDYVGSTVDPRTRTFPIEVEVDNPGSVIKPEMVASARLVRQVSEGVIVVPQEAVVRTETGYRAFVVEGSADNAVARAVDVELGAGRDDVVHVVRGLRAGQQLVVLGQQQLADGDRVRIVTGEVR